MARSILIGAVLAAGSLGGGGCALLPPASQSPTVSGVLETTITGRTVNEVKNTLTLKMASEGFDVLQEGGANIDFVRNNASPNLVQTILGSDRREAGEDIVSFKMAANDRAVRIVAEVAPGAKHELAADLQRVLDAATHEMESVSFARQTHSAPAAARLADLQISQTPEKAPASTADVELAWADLGARAITPEGEELVLAGGRPFLKPAPPPAQSPSAPSGETADDLHQSADLSGAVFAEEASATRERISFRRYRMDR